MYSDRLGGKVFEPGATAVTAAWRTMQRADLQTLYLVRAIAIAGQTLSVGLSVRMPEQPLPAIALGALSLLFVIPSLLILERVRRESAADDAGFFKQILVDVAVLTYLLMLSGGPANPFHDLYILPVTIAAATLPAMYVWRTAAVVIGCYTLLEFVHLPLATDQPLVVEFVRLAELTDHVLLAMLLCYFVVRMSQGLRERDRQLAEAHEREIRAGCAIAVGSVAAGAAHELATPLSTISMVLDDLREDRRQQPELKQSLETLQASLGACLLCLKDLRSCGDAWIKGGDVVPADQFLKEVIRRFRELRPAVHVAHAFKRPIPGPLVVPDIALQQAIINLLTNAVFVSPLDIEVSASWDAKNLVVQVADKGPGISPELAEQLGRVLVTTKPPDAGHGIGLFLTNVTASRLGGRLRLFNAPEGGAVAEIIVPLASLQKKESFNEQVA